MRWDDRKMVGHEYGIPQSISRKKMDTKENQPNRMLWTLYPMKTIGCARANI
jgi:hypothetical protein